MSEIHRYKCDVCEAEESFGQHAGGWLRVYAKSSGTGVDVASIDLCPRCVVQPVFAPLLDRIVSGNAEARAISSLRDRMTATHELDFRLGAYGGWVRPSDREATCVPFVKNTREDMERWLRENA